MPPKLHSPSLLPRIRLLPANTAHLPIFCSALYCISWAKPGEEQSCTSPANLNSWTILGARHLGDEYFRQRFPRSAIPGFSHHHWGRCFCFLLCSYYTISASLGSTYRCCRVCGFYLSPGFSDNDRDSSFSIFFFFSFCMIPRTRRGNAVMYCLVHARSLTTLLGTRSWEALCFPFYHGWLWFCYYDFNEFTLYKDSSLSSHSVCV